MIAALEPTFGGINLEDIKAPDCFYVERKLRERMKIPVFHDDQHGTPSRSARHPQRPEGRRQGHQERQAGTSGAGAAAPACLGLLVKLGVPANIFDRPGGVVYTGRKELMDEDNAVRRRPPRAR